MPKREFFSTNEVAQMLGISPFTIRRYINLRKLKAVKLEGGYRVRQSDLELFLKARELETEEELDAAAEEETEAKEEPPRKKAPPISTRKKRAPRAAAREPKRKPRASARDDQEE